MRYCFFLIFILPVFSALSQSVTIIKGPYLQVGTPNSVMVKWETNVACDSKVQYGINSGSLTSSANDALNVLSHEITIGSLSPYTKYYYNIGTSSLVLQGDTNNYFITSPLPGASGKYRFWVTGDCGNGSTNQVNVRDQYLNYNAGKRTNGWLLLGDNAYYSGTQSEYNTLFFNYYQGNIMKKTVLWPAPGNHDYLNGTVTHTNVPYYDIFTTPTAAQAGGVASGTEAYYSFDYGNIHFISLDSYGTTGASLKMYDTLGAQALWLKQDLAANNKLWTVAYWHHPPFTMGSHNSDTELDLVTIRHNFIRILERYKVDLILCGHSHSYERSKLMQGHYGSESTFTASMHHLDSSSAVYDGSPNSCPYVKDTINKKSGTVYVVAGSAGQLGGLQSSFPHDAMYYSDITNGGSVILDFDHNRLDLQWLCADGVIRDKFTLFKNVNKVSSYTVNPGQQVGLQASWPGAYAWSHSVSVNPVSVSSFSNATFWVSDTYSCVADTFYLKVLPAVNFSNSGLYCAGQTLQFQDNSSNNPTSWLWSVNPSVGVNINNPLNQNPLINFASASQYSVTLIASNSFGPGLAYTQTLTVNPNPFVLYTNATPTICAGESITLSATGSPSYSWSTGHNTHSITVSPGLSSVYTTTFTNQFGCQSIGSVQVLVLACVGLNENKWNDDVKISVFPQGLVVDLSSLPEQPLLVELMDLQGKTLYSASTGQLHNCFDVVLPAGLYFYRVKTKEHLLAKGKVFLAPD